MKQFRSRKKTEEDIDIIVRKGFKIATKMFIGQIDEKVPVYTGMAKGAFSRLAKYANATLDFSNAHPEWGYYRDENYNVVKVWKDKRLGESQASKPPFLRKSKSGRYSFNFETRVFHYWLRDTNYIPGGKRTPWRSFEYGSQAFAARLGQYLRRNLSKVLLPTHTITQNANNLAPNVNIGRFFRID